MKSNEIARKFYEQGLSDKRLSRKQTDWLYQQYCREANRHVSHHGTPVAGGLFTLDDGTSIGWDIAVSPRNGCSIFQTRNITELSQRQDAERQELLARGKEFAQTAKNSPMADHYDAQLLARMFKVSVELAQEWLNQK